MLSVIMVALVTMVVSWALLWIRDISLSAFTMSFLTRLEKTCAEIDPLIKITASGRDMYLHYKVPPQELVSALATVRVTMFGVQFRPGHIIPFKLFWSSRVDLQQEVKKALELE
jgi:hypothetical protein